MLTRQGGSFSGREERWGNAQNTKSSGWKRRETKRRVGYKRRSVWGDERKKGGLAVPSKIGRETNTIVKE